MKKNNSHGPGAASAEKSARRILRFLASRKEKISPLFILTHDYPDPDALASAFALSHVAQKRFGISTRIAYGGIIGRMENRAMVQILKIPAHRLQSSDFKKYQHIAMMDTQPFFENNPFPKNRRAALVVDQHPFVKKPAADLAIIDPECGATSVILAQVLIQAKMEIPGPVATALAYGILSDTMNLYRARRMDVVETYLEILSHCDLRALARIQNPVRSKKFFSTLSKAIQNAASKRGLMAAHLGPVESPDLVSQITDFLLTYKGVRKVICTGRYKGKLHVSLRIAKPGVDASEMLRDVFIHPGKAGGHDNIAGGSFEVGPRRKGPLALDDPAWDSAEEELIQRLLKRLRLPAKGEFYYPFR